MVIYDDFKGRCTCHCHNSEKCLVNLPMDTYWCFWKQERAIWEQKENCSDWGLTSKWGNIKPKKGLNSKKLYSDITSKRAVARKGNGVSGVFIFCFCFSKLNLKVISL